MNRALLVGINAYPDPQDALQGCLNDISDMAAFLSGPAGFDSADIRLLADARATAQAIREHLTWLVTGLQAGDRVVFHYSGHGAQFPTRDAAGNVSEVHDTIVPFDFDWTVATAIRDVDFQSIFGAIPAGVKFVWVSDSCFSGGLTREIVPRNGQRKTAKHLTPPIDIAWRSHTVDTSRRFITRCTTLRDVAGYLNLALLSGCTAVETAADASFNNRSNGALTYYLLQELSNTHGLTETLSVCAMAVVNALKFGGYSQTPELHGTPANFEQSFPHDIVSKAEAILKQSPVSIDRLSALPSSLNGSAKIISPLPHQPDLNGPLQAQIELASASTYAFIASKAGLPLDILHNEKELLSINNNAELRRLGHVWRNASTTYGNEMARSLGWYATIALHNTAIDESWDGGSLINPYGLPNRTDVIEVLSAKSEFSGTVVQRSHAVPRGASLEESMTAAQCIIHAYEMFNEGSAPLEPDPGEMPEDFELHDYVIMSDWNPNPFHSKIDAFYGFLATSKDLSRSVFCLRGTVGRLEWLADFTFPKVPFFVNGKQYGSVHSGFANTLKTIQIRPRDAAARAFNSPGNMDVTPLAIQVRDAFKRHRDSKRDIAPPQPKLIIAGHSLGAGILTLYACEQAVRQLDYFNTVNSYTFGSPRAGDFDFAAAYISASAANPTSRFVDVGDGVTDVPPDTWDWRHVGYEIKLDPPAVPNDIPSRHNMKSYEIGLQAYFMKNSSPLPDKFVVADR